MADRKISELPPATRVYDADYLVVVTGVNQLKNPSNPEEGYVDLVTSRVPISGLSAWSFRVNEVVSGCTGIQIIPQVNTGLFPAKINTISICATGLAYANHTHTASDISDFGSSVSGLVEQRIVMLSNNIAKTGTETLVSGLSLSLNSGTKYLCEVGIIVSGTSTSTRFSGVISSTGIEASNANLLSVHGTWNGTNSSVTGLSLLATGINSGDQTLVHKFTVSTYNTESDTIRLKFSTDNIDGGIKAGSWLKAEKVI